MTFLELLHDVGEAFQGKDGEVAVGDGDGVVGKDIKEFIGEAVPHLQMLDVLIRFKFRQLVDGLLFGGFRFFGSKLLLRFLPFHLPGAVAEVAVVDADLFGELVLVDVIAGDILGHQLVPVVFARHEVTSFLGFAGL